MSRRILDMPCPGCGLSRSFVALSHGNLWAALRFHPLGPFLYLLCLLQIPYRIGEYLGASRSWPLWARASQRLSLLVWALIFALFFTWAARIVAL